MQDHRTSDEPEDDESRDRDPVDEQAAAFSDGVTDWLAGHAGPPEPDIEAVAIQAMQQAWAWIAQAAERALSVTGLIEPMAAELARLYERAARLAGREADEDLVARRSTSAQRERIAWFDQHSHIASEPGGIHRWEALPEPLRWVLYSARVLTVQHVRELAERGELLSIEGVGPARQRQIMAALADLDPRDRKPDQP